MSEWPITPYHAGTDSGWSGSAASEARAIRRDANGATLRLQTRLFLMVTNRLSRGLTVAEARAAIPSQHHGSISGALSNLHKAGKVACLVETRDKCHIYVAPDFVRGRETRRQGR